MFNENFHGTQKDSESLQYLIKVPNITQTPLQSFRDSEFDVLEFGVIGLIEVFKPVIDLPLAPVHHKTDFTLSQLRIPRYEIRTQSPRSEGFEAIWIFRRDSSLWET